MLSTTKNFNTLTIDQLARYAPSIFAEHGSSKVSEKYVHIPTINVVQGMIKEGFYPVKAHESRARLEAKKGFTKHLIRFRHIDTVMNKDGLFPEVVLINSHDGSSSYRLMSGLYRLVCTNGLISGETYEQLRVRHQGDIVGNVIEGTYKVVEQAKTMLEHADYMSGIELSQDERLILAESAHMIRFDESNPQREAIKPEQFLRAKRYSEKGRNDLFTTFNVIQENSIKGGLSGWTRDANNRPLRTTTRAVKSIDSDTSINRALWTLAEKMAELKKSV